MFWEEDGTVVPPDHTKMLNTSSQMRVAVFWLCVGLDMDTSTEACV